jgi:hypothetical protein
MIVSDVGRTMSGSSSAAAVRDDCHLRRESLDVLGLLVQEALGNEKREVGVLVSRRLEHVVQGALHPFPDAVAVRADDPASANG